MKEQWTDISLQRLTLRTLHLALSDNPRGQNHFKSIGGLEVLLDGLGLPSTNVLLKNASHIDVKRYISVCLCVCVYANLCHMTFLLFDIP